MERQKIMPEVEAESPAHDPEIEMAHRAEIPCIVNRVDEIFGEIGKRNLGRPTQGVQLIALKETLGSAAIGNREQQRHGEKQCQSDPFVHRKRQRSMLQRLPRAQPPATASEASLDIMS